MMSIGFTVTGPQFERTDGRTISYVPQSQEQWDTLPSLRPETLRLMGLGVWDETDEGTHWLYPGEWYGHIPVGTQITDINGETEAFIPGKTDDDTRFGCLAYGFIQPKAHAKETTK